MTEPFQRILESDDPSGPIRDAVLDPDVLRLLNQHIFSSLFSSYVARRPASWVAQAAETALRVLAEGAGAGGSYDSLLEIAFHANLALVGADDFYRNVIRIEDVLQQLEQRGLLSRSSQYVKGLLSYVRDDLEAAERAFSSLPDVSDTPMLAYQAGYPAFRAPGFFRTLASYEPSIRLEVIQKPGRLADDAVVLLCSVDDLYFAAFADEFAAQVFEVSTSAHIHFHLVNNQAEPSLLARTNLLSNPRVSLSTERTDLSKPEWYAIMARYIVLPSIMLEWGKPVLVTDIDLVVRTDPVSIETDHGVLLGFSDNRAAAFIPTTTVLGGHNLFQPNDAGLAFAQALSRYLHKVCQDRRGVWVADQIALLMVWRMFRNVISIGDLKNIPTYSYGPSPDRPLKKKAAKDRLSELM